MMVQFLKPLLLESLQADSSKRMQPPMADNSLPKTNCVRKKRLSLIAHANARDRYYTTSPRRVFNLSSCSLLRINASWVTCYCCWWFRKKSTLLLVIQNKAVRPLKPTKPPVFMVFWFFHQFYSRTVLRVNWTGHRFGSRSNWPVRSSFIYVVPGADIACQ